MIGAGDVSLESAGEESDTTFEDVRHPESVQKTIYEAREQDEQRRAQPQQPQQPPQAQQASPPERTRPAAVPDGASSGTTAPPAAPTHPGGALPVADELAKLASLRDQGVISEAEFQAQKSRLLGS
jgi:hypothetical protein